MLCHLHGFRVHLIFDGTGKTLVRECSWVRWHGPDNPVVIHNETVFARDPGVVAVIVPTQVMGRRQKLLFKCALLAFVVTEDPNDFFCRLIDFDNRILITELDQDAVIMRVIGHSISMGPVIVTGEPRVCQ